MDWVQVEGERREKYVGREESGGGVSGRREGFTKGER